MKTLKKEEMLKKDQVKHLITLQYISTHTHVSFSWPMYAQNAMFWLNRTLLGLSNFIIRFKTQRTSILSWSFCLVAIL